MTNKWPRHYAAEIIALPTREQRRLALANVPEHLRDMTADHVTRHYELQKYRKKR